MIEKGNYTHPLVPGNGDLLTVKEYLEMVASYAIMDDDGSSWPVKDGMEARGFDSLVYPSKPETLPKDATHVVWYNK